MGRHGASVHPGLVRRNHLQVRAGQSRYGKITRIPKATVQGRLGEQLEILQSARIFKVNCCLMTHNVHLNLASPISGLLCGFCSVLCKTHYTLQGEHSLVNRFIVVVYEKF